MSLIMDNLKNEVGKLKEIKIHNKTEIKDLKDKLANEKADNEKL